MKLAVIETGGKQYLVQEGQIIKAEKMSSTGDHQALAGILLVADGEQVEVGTPQVKTAKVEVKRLTDGRAKKVIVEKFKRKVRYHKKQGHRQAFTSLQINKISL
ncbi:MAG: 50S ribosomal protein L21 [Patescibacteria group bacterium]